MPERTDCMIELTPTMTKSEAIAAQNANNANFDGPFVSSQIFEKSAAASPTIGGNSTTRDLTVAEGTNPNRMTILLTSATSASSAIRLRVGTGTYYNLIWPKPSTAVNILSLLAGTPYDLVFSGTAWIVKDYVETVSNANGTYRKHADGTLECWKKVTTTGVNLDVTAGSLYSSGYTIGGGPWPHTFTSAPTEVGAASFQSPLHPTLTCRGAPPSASAAGSFAILSPFSDQTNRTVILDIYAIGRWY
jgi:hypothetical protein